MGADSTGGSIRIQNNSFSIIQKKNYQKTQREKTQHKKTQHTKTQQRKLNTF